jgi:hypothetical protein
VIATDSEVQKEDCCCCWRVSGGGDREALEEAPWWAEMEIVEAAAGDSVDKGQHCRQPVVLVAAG